MPKGFYPSTFKYTYPPQTHHQIPIIFHSFSNIDDLLSFTSTVIHALHTHALCLKISYPSLSIVIKVPLSICRLIGVALNLQSALWCRPLLIIQYETSIIHSLIIQYKSSVTHYPIWIIYHSYTHYPIWIIYYSFTHYPRWIISVHTSLPST